MITRPAFRCSNGPSLWIRTSPWHIFGCQKVTIHSGSSPAPPNPRAKLTELRDRTTEGEQLSITAYYRFFALGDLEGARTAAESVGANLSA